MATGTHRDTRFPQRLPRFLRSHANMYSSNMILLGLRVAQLTLAFVVIGLTAFGMSQGKRWIEDRRAVKANIDLCSCPLV